MQHVNNRNVMKFELKFKSCQILLILHKSKIHQILRCVHTYLDSSDRSGQSRAVVVVVKPGLPAEVVRVLAGVLPVLVAVDSVWSMACSRAGEIPTVQLLSDDCRR